MSLFADTEAREDFNRARKQAFFQEIAALFGGDRRELLSLQEVRETLRPRGERYQGMRTVPLDKIVGSEGRYQDFNTQFLPRYEHLRKRWQRVDMAHLTDVVLPPIKLYQVGDVYFVRDGNHRVSVARLQGVLSIDAEVIALETEIPMHASMTRENLRKAVIEHEYHQFRLLLQIDSILGDSSFIVSDPGAYDELARHIYGHKYFLNEKDTVEIPLSAAIQSWYNNVYTPLIAIIQRSRLMSRFPGKTPTDLYLWIIRHWHILKEQYGEDFPAEVAASDYAKRYGRGVLHRVLRRVMSYFGFP
jgi:hypothetical protein